MVVVVVDGRWRNREDVVGGGEGERKRKKNTCLAWQMRGQGRPSKHQNQELGTDFRAQFSLILGRVRARARLVEKGKVWL